MGSRRVLCCAVFFFFFVLFFFFFNDTATTEIYTLSLHDALPICTAEPVVGDYVEFVPPENRYYKNINFVKQIIAGPGDVEVCDGRRFFLDGELIATAKTHSQGGYPLTLGPCGEIPEGQYFVVTPHKDSFDSRYGEIGYVARTHILGVARPIL